MKPVSYWRKAHRRNSVRALIASTVVSFVGAVWAALPGALVDRLPTWAVLSVPLMLGVLGLFGAYTSQPGLDE